MNVTPKQHAFFATSITFVAMGIIYFILIWPALAARTLFLEHWERLQFQQQKLAETVGMTPSLEKELAALSNLEIEQSSFLEQKPRDLAAADLQRQLNLLIEDSGGNLISTQVLPPNEEETVFPGITMRLRANGRIESLRELLYMFNVGQPRLFADNLLIQKKGGNEAARSDADLLDIRLDVTAYIYSPLQ